MKILFLLPEVGSIVEFEYFKVRYVGTVVKIKDHDTQPEIYGLVCRIEVSKNSIYEVSAENIIIS